MKVEKAECWALLTNIVSDLKIIKQSQEKVIAIQHDLMALRQVIEPLSVQYQGQHDERAEECYPAAEIVRNIEVFYGILTRYVGQMTSQDLGNL